MPLARFVPAVFLALLGACVAPTRPLPPPTPPATTPAASWRGVALLPEAWTAGSAATLEVVLVAIDGDEERAIAHSETAVAPSERIAFALPVARVAASPAPRFGWRVGLRDDRGRLRYASAHRVEAERDAIAQVPLQRVILP